MARFYHVARYGHGVPIAFSDDTQGDGGEAAYRAYLEELAQAFGEYVAFMSDVDEYGLDVGNRRYEALIARMRRLFDHFAGLAD